MAMKRKSHTAAIKAQVALAAVKGDKTVSELASLHGVHPTLIHAWKKQLVNNAEELFQNGARTSSGVSGDKGEHGWEGSVPGQRMSLAESLRIHPGLSRRELLYC